MTVSRQPYSGPRKLVLAFDIGTTYSGISYCILQPGEIPEIHGVNRFPEQPSGQGNAKVPSVLYYDDIGNVKAAGSEALTMSTMDTAMENGWTKAEWWKLHLRPKYLSSTHIKEDDIPPLPCGKTAVDVLTDFIKYLFQCTKTYIQERHPGFKWSSIEDSIEFIFSHPNGWEGRQQQQYRDAIGRAGLIPSTPEGRSRVYMVTEGEASLHFCVASLRNDPGSDGPQGVVVIDAGGGTIDLSMYSMTSNPVACNEIAPAECRLQGSVFVTRRAADLLKGKLQGSPHCSPEEMDVITREFDHNTKHTIGSVDKPVYVKIGNIFYNMPQYNIKRGALMLSGTEVADLFNESIDAIIDAFEQQRKSAKSKVTMAFLVGGLGTSGLLWTRLQSHFQAQGLKIFRPDNDINKAVANGAVLYHINRDNHLVRSRVARATYGLPASTFVDENDPEHLCRKDKWEKNGLGQYLIRGTFHPLLRKGEQIDQEKEIRRHCHAYKSSRDKFGDHNVEIMCYRGTLSNPRWTDEDPSSFSHLCTIQADLRELAKNSVAMKTDSGKVYYKVTYDVVALFGKTELTAQIAWKMNGKEERSPAVIVYYDN